MHEAHAEVTLAPGRYFVRPLVVRLVRERGRWLIDAWKFAPRTQVGDCFMDGSGQYLDGDWKWPQVTDATVSEYVDRVCTRAVAEHVYERKGHRAASGRINRAVFLAMFREGEIRLRD